MQAGLDAVGIILHETQSEIVRMSVNPSFRRKGVARKLFEQALHESIKNHKKSIKVLTDPPWDGAISFYKSMGFVEVERDDKDVHLIYEILSE